MANPQPVKTSDLGIRFINTLNPNRITELKIQWLRQVYENENYNFFISEVKLRNQQNELHKIPASLSQKIFSKVFDKIYEYTAKNIIAEFGKEVNQMFRIYAQELHFLITSAVKPDQLSYEISYNEKILQNSIDAMSTLVLRAEYINNLEQKAKTHQTEMKESAPMNPTATQPLQPMHPCM